MGFKNINVRENKQTKTNKNKQKQRKTNKNKQKQTKINKNKQKHEYFISLSLFLSTKKYYKLISKKYSFPFWIFHFPFWNLITSTE